MIPARQLAGTTIAHKAHCFVLELTAEEMLAAETRSAQFYGNEHESERTYVEVYHLRTLLTMPITDWANLGMIFSAIMGNNL
jgi:hypothetical protein